MRCSDFISYLCVLRLIFLERSEVLLRHAWQLEKGGREGGPEHYYYHVGE
jgi:hypothetical protein